MKKTKHDAAVQEVIAALRSTKRFTRAERDRLSYLLEGKSPPEIAHTKARPAHRPQNSWTTSNNLAILELVFQYRANDDQLTALKAGDTSSIGSEDAAMVIRSLEGRSAKNMTQAIKMTAEWFASRQLHTATKAKINNVVWRDLYEYAEDIKFKPYKIETASEWNLFKAFVAAQKKES